MYIKYTPLLTALLLISSFNASALQLGGIPVNAYPEANDDSISLVAGVYILAEGNVSSNDRYGTTYTLNDSWVGKYGLITSFDSDGEYTYALFEGTTNASLPPGGIGIDTFRYTLANESGQTDSAQLTIDIRANPNPSQSPIAVDDHASVVVSDKPSAIGNVSDNDLYGNIVSFNQSTGQYGFITLLDSSGSYVYTLFQGTDNASLAPGGIGTDSFTYTYTNSVGLSDTAQLIVNVSANKAQSPIAIDDHESVIISEKPSAIGNVSTNDLYGSIVSFSQSTGQYGFLTLLDSSGSYIYTLFEGTDNASLAPTGVGTDSFTYTYTNNVGLSDTAQLIINVSANITQSPLANDDHGSVVIGVKPNATGNVTTNDFNGEIVTFSESLSGQYGFLTVTDSKGDYIYQLFDSTDSASLPSGGVGIDSFTYTLANASGETDTAKLIIDIKVTQAGQPIANDDHISLVAGVYVLAEGNVSSNDLYGTIYTVNGSWVGQYGAITSFDSAGEYTYELFEGTDNASLPPSGVGIDSFTYTLANETGLTDTAQLIIDISANSTHPIANDDHESVVISEKPSATGNVSDNDLYGSIVLFNQSSGEYGFLTVTGSSGSYTYTLFENISLPSSGTDTDSFTYTYANAEGLTDTAKLTIKVSANKAPAPIANNDHKSVVIDEKPTVVGNVTTNDFNGEIVFFEGSASGQYGFLTLTDTTGGYIYKLYKTTDHTSLPSGGVGTDRFTYTLANASGETDTAKLIIDVTATQINQPIANDDYESVVITEKPSTSGNVSDNDLYGSIVSFNQSSGQYGFLTITGSSGSYQYTLFDSTDHNSLPPGGVGTDSFTYTLANASGETDTAELIINVSTTLIDQPIANDDYESVVITEKPSASGNVSDNDLYGSIVSFNQSSGQYGFLTVTGSSGSYQYTLFDSTDHDSLPPGGVGTDSFTYTLANDLGVTDTAELFINVSTTLIDQPIANDDYESVVITEKPSASGNVSDNDLYGSIVTFNQSSGQYGFLTVTGSSGSYQYTLFDSTDHNSLPSGGVDTDSFTYTLANDRGVTDTAKLIINVSTTLINQPIAIDDYESVVIKEKPSASGNVSDNDLYGSIVSFKETSGLYGFLTLTGSSGEYTYTLFTSTDNSKLPPNGDSDTFNYTYANENGLIATADLIINVYPDPAGSISLIARDDFNTAIPNKLNPVSGNLTDNDNYGDYVQLIDPIVGTYGTLILEAEGTYSYSLNLNSLNVINLKSGELVADVFKYNYFSYSDENNSASASLTIQIVGNPVDADGNPIFENPNDDPYDNVDIEFNNRSAVATPLNSNRNIRGHLYDSGDKDWFYLTSTGNEIITLDVCPQGTTCFGKKSWVLYVFDPDKLTLAMEERTYGFNRWLDDTGSTKDESGTEISPPMTVSPSSSNHMYLAYKADFFEGALIGIIDPCFDEQNTVDIGVGPGPKDYLIAISSPLEGGGSDHKPTGKCGDGSVVLERPGLAVSGTDADGEQKNYATTEEYIVAFPYSDDQYAIKITGTGLEPLNSTTAVARSTKYNPFNGDLNIPTIRVGGESYQANLKQEESSANSPIKFILADIKHLSLEQVVVNYRATYNFENEQVMIPRVTVTNTGKGYSVILQLHTSDDGKKTWFEVVNIKEINKN